MVENELPFGCSTAERLMAVAHDRRLTNLGSICRPIGEPSTNLPDYLTRCSRRGSPTARSSGYGRGVVESLVTTYKQKIACVAYVVKASEPQPMTSGPLKVVSWNQPVPAIEYSPGGGWQVDDG